MDALEVTRALNALDKNDALTVVVGWLSDNGFPHKIWSPEDLEEYVSVAQDGLDPEDVVRRAQESYYWRALSECTEYDWELVSLAVDEATSALKG